MPQQMYSCIACSVTEGINIHTENKKKGTQDKKTKLPSSTVHILKIQKKKEEKAVCSFLGPDFEDSP